MGDLLRLVCEERGHVPKDIDPTGGDPWMGGPVAITVCDRCGREIERSETAKAFNKRVRETREHERRMEERNRASSPEPLKRKHWWSR